MTVLLFLRVLAQRLFANGMDTFDINDMSSSSSEEGSASSISDFSSSSSSGGGGGGAAEEGEFDLDHLELDGGRAAEGHDIPAAELAPTAEPRDEAREAPLLPEPGDELGAEPEAEVSATLATEVEAEVVADEGEDAMEVEQVPVGVEVERVEPMAEPKEGQGSRLAATSASGLKKRTVLAQYAEWKSGGNNLQDALFPAGTGPGPGPGPAVFGTAIEVGMRVLVVGLTNPRALYMNGRAGTVLEVLPALGRLLVQVDGFAHHDCRRAKLKPAVLRKEPPGDQPQPQAQRPVRQQPALRPGSAAVKSIAATRLQRTWRAQVARAAAADPCHLVRDAILALAQEQQEQLCEKMLQLSKTQIEEVGAAEGSGLSRSGLRRVLPVVPASWTVPPSVAAAVRAGEQVELVAACGLVQTATALFMQEPSVNSVELRAGARLTMVGSLCGHLRELLHILHRQGEPRELNMLLLNGGLVGGGGGGGCEVLLLACMLKILQPSAVLINRGSPETEGHASATGALAGRCFQEECAGKYGQVFFELCLSLFDALPLGLVVQRKVLAVHGGISHRFDLQRLMAVSNAADNGDADQAGRSKGGGEGVEDWRVVEDVLWSQPMNELGAMPRSRSSRAGGSDGSTGSTGSGGSRGVEAVKAVSASRFGVCFGPDVTRDFLESEALSLLVRSGCCPEPKGFKRQHGGRCCTLFSCTDYAKAGTLAAYLTLSVEEETALEGENNPLAAKELKASLTGLTNKELRLRVKGLRPTAQQMAACAASEDPREAVEQLAAALAIAARPREKRGEVGALKLHHNSFGQVDLVREEGPNGVAAAPTTAGGLSRRDEQLQQIDSLVGGLVAEKSAALQLFWESHAGLSRSAPSQLSQAVPRGLLEEGAGIVPGMGEGAAASRAAAAPQPAARPPAALSLVDHKVDHKVVDHKVVNYKVVDHKVVDHKVVDHKVVEAEAKAEAEAEAALDTAAAAAAVAADGAHAAAGFASRPPDNSAAPGGLVLPRAPEPSQRLVSLEGFFAGLELCKLGALTLEHSRFGPVRARLLDKCARRAAPDPEGSTAEGGVVDYVVDYGTFLSLYGGGLDSVSGGARGQQGHIGHAGGGEEELAAVEGDDGACDDSGAVPAPAVPLFTTRFTQIVALQSVKSKRYLHVRGARQAHMDPVCQLSRLTAGGQWVMERHVGGGGQQPAEQDASRGQQVTTPRCTAAAATPLRHHRALQQFDNLRCATDDGTAHPLSTVWQQVAEHPPLCAAGDAAQCPEPELSVLCHSRVHSHRSGPAAGQGPCRPISRGPSPVGAPVRRRSIRQPALPPPRRPAPPCPKVAVGALLAPVGPPRQSRLSFDSLVILLWFNAPQTPSKLLHASRALQPNQRAPRPAHRNPRGLSSQSVFVEPLNQSLSVDVC